VSLPLTSYLFYLGNILLIGAYITTIGLVVAPEGMFRRSRSRQPLLGIQKVWFTLFLACAVALHFDMAYHVLSGNAFFDAGPHGVHIDTDFAVILSAKALCVVGFMASTIVKTRRERRYEEGV
jgi:hypothetical protein